MYIYITVYLNEIADLCSFNAMVTHSHLSKWTERCLSLMQKP